MNIDHSRIHAALVIPYLATLMGCSVQADSQPDTAAQEEVVGEAVQAANVTPEGCTWDGYWYTLWGGATGDPNSYIGNMWVGSTYDGSTAWGNYTSGNNWTWVGDLTNAYVSYDGYHFTGYWQRTSGNAGLCQYGRFSLGIYHDLNGCHMSGYWTYCDDDPDWSSQRFLWTGTHY